MVVLSICVSSTPYKTQRPEVVLWSKDHIQYKKEGFQHRTGQRSDGRKPASWKTKKQRKQLHLLRNTQID